MTNQPAQQLITDNEPQQEVTNGVFVTDYNLLCSIAWVILSHLKGDK